MAIQSSVLLLASFLFAANALSGLRRSPATIYTCPNARFPCKDRCEVMHGPCLSALDHCDANDGGTCQLTTCYRSCGCGKRPGPDLTCFNMCNFNLGQGQAANALQICVTLYTPWISESQDAYKNRNTGGQHRRRRGKPFGVQSLDPNAPHHRRRGVPKGEVPTDPPGLNLEMLRNGGTWPPYNAHTDRGLGRRRRGVSVTATPSSGNPEQYQ